MNKIFLFAKHAKTGENHNKLSKSVSYETLVGGTTTECSAYKQTQHLNKGCADTPLTAVGTLTSQLCCSTKVVENLLHCHPEPQTKNPEKTKNVMPDLIGYLSRIKKEFAEILGSRLSSCPRMTFSTFTLAAVLSVGIISESRAESGTSDYFGSGDPIFGSGDPSFGSGCPGGTYACGSSCVPTGRDCYMYDDKGRISEITRYNDNNSRNEKTILDYDDSGVIGGAVQYQTGDGSWTTFNTIDVQPNDDGSKLITPRKIVTDYYFAGYAAIMDSQGNIIQDGNRWLKDDFPWRYNLATYTYDEQTGQRTSRTTYNCWYTSGPTACTQKTTQDYSYEYDEFDNIIAEKINGVVVATRTYSEDYLANQEAKKCNSTKSCTSCPSGKVLQGGECVSTCGASFKLNDGECDRIRYTPAEAAQYLKDTDNEIIMTFKVNR